MSNCIIIRNTFKIPIGDINVDALREIDATHADHTTLEPADWYCWYLRGTWTVKNGNVVFKFGTGASGHTWRDFRLVIGELSNYILQNHVVTGVLTVSDEYDNFSTSGPLYVELMHRKYRLGISEPMISV